MRPTCTALVAFTLPFLAACSDSGVAAVRIALEPDLSGTVTASALLLAESAGPLESHVGGVDWDDRANLYCARGTFRDVRGLKIADIAISAGSNDDFSYVKLVLPNDDGARWMGALAPAPDQRERVARTFDPRRTYDEVATHVTFEIDVPGRVLGHTVTPRSRGVASKLSRGRVTLVVPLDRIRSAREPWEWLISWK